MSINKVILIGHCGKNPEVKFTSSGTAVCKFSLATNETFKDKNGEPREHTEWHSIVCFGKLAERSGEMLSRGKHVYLEGSIRSHKWEDQDGNERKAYDIVARWMQILSSAKNGSGTQAGKPPSGNASDADEEDNPFRDDQAPAQDVQF